MKKIGIFYWIYFGFIALFLILLIAGLSVLRNFLKTYEAAQPKNIAQDICDEFIKYGKVEELKDKYNLKLSDYEDIEKAQKVLEEAVAGKKLEVFHSSRTPEGSEICFSIKADDKAVAFVALSKSDKKMAFGLQGYSVDSIFFSNDLYKTVSVIFPSSATVCVNGKTASKEDIISASLPEIRNYTFGEDAVYQCLLQIPDMLCATAQVTVEADDASEYTVSKTEDYYSVEQRFSDDLTAEIVDFALEGAKVYAAHMQDAASLAAVAKYVDTKSKFYESLADTITRFAWKHDSYSFENVECSSLMKHSEEIYSCRIKFVNVLKLGSNISKDPFDKRVYVRVSGKTKKIIDMQRIE
ncbi:MAG: hypothetical protein IKZ47_06945 [Clostridia bacterium]|nr:hypothetical protein [Clostridia bacterium]